LNPKLELTMIDKISSWKYTEEFVREADQIARARRDAHELGVEAITPATGNLLALIARAMNAKNIVEVGTGAGVSGLWLLSATEHSVLTTIDSEPEYQNAARESFKAAGITPSRTRVIAGRAKSVMANMTEGAYDLVFIDLDPSDIEEILPGALALLRPGGLLAIAHALWRDRVPNPTLRDDETTSLRSVIKSFAAQEDFIANISMVGDGLLLVAREI
jgi:predicted O-methyltransferase YrrM